MESWRTSIGDLTSFCSLAYLLSSKYCKSSAQFPSSLPCTFFLTYYTLLNRCIVYWLSPCIRIKKKVPWRAGIFGYISIAYLWLYLPTCRPFLTSWHSISICWIEWKFANLEPFTASPPHPLSCLLFLLYPLKGLFLVCLLLTKDCFYPELVISFKPYNYLFPRSMSL